MKDFIYKSISTVAFLLKQASILFLLSTVLVLIGALLTVVALPVIVLGALLGEDD